MLNITWCFRGNFRHPEVTWRLYIQYDPFRGDLIHTTGCIHMWIMKVLDDTFNGTYMCWVTEKTCMKVLRCSRKRVVASVCANSCCAGWWEALLVTRERGEHCERCYTCTGRYKRWCDGLEAPEDWLTEHHCWWLQVAVCIVATALVFLPTNNTRSRLKKLPSAGQGSSGAKLMSRGNLPIQAAVRNSARHSASENHSKVLTRKQT